MTTALLCTSAFLAAAREQWQSLGFQDGTAVAVAHPITSLTEEKVRQEADRALDEVLSLVLEAGDAGA